jgi:membrane-bound metal-dependent hydrolase YbcI (DUF457 family)
VKIPEHIALSYLVAQFGAQQQYGTMGTVLVLIAGCLPDGDGISLLGGWKLYRNCHRVLGHGILVSLLGPVLLTLLGTNILGLYPWLPLWVFLQVALLLHLFTDVVFYRWPVQLLWPFSARAWAGGLVAWNDLVPTLTLYGCALAGLVWPRVAPLAGAAGITLLLGYLGWRAQVPRPQHGWGAWLTGGWAPSAAPIWRWLTGDFIT